MNTIHVRRVAPAWLVACLLAALGCSKPADKGEAATSSAPPTPAAPEKPAETPKAEAPPEKPAAPPPAERPRIGDLLGSKKDGWTPKAVSALKRGMTPEEAEAVLPGATTVSKFGFAEVKAPKGSPGAYRVELYFAKKDGVPKELQSVKLLFDGAVSDDALWDDLVKVCTEKYGATKPEDLQKKLVTWAGPKSGMAQLHRGFHEGDGWQLDVTLQR